MQIMNNQTMRMYPLTPVSDYENEFLGMDALTICPECGCDVPDTLVTCPECGAKMK